MKNAMMMAVVAVMVLVVGVGCSSVKRNGIMIETDRASLRAPDATSAVRVIEALHTSPELTKSDAMGRNAYDALVASNPETVEAVVEVTRIQQSGSNASGGSGNLGRFTRKLTRDGQLGSVVNYRSQPIDVTIVDGTGQEVARMVVPASSVTKCEMLPGPYQFICDGKARPINIDTDHGDASFQHPQTKVWTITDWKMPYR